MISFFFASILHDAVKMHYVNMPKYGNMFLKIVYYITVCVHEGLMLYLQIVGSVLWFNMC